MTRSQLSPSDTKSPAILAFCSFKGGVGKTAICLNLAYKMAKSGQRVMVVDLDPLGAATRILARSASNAAGAYDLIAGRGTRDGLSVPSWIENISVLPSTALLHLAEIEPAVQDVTTDDLRRRLQSGTEETDAVLIDCGPGLGIMAVNAIAASDMVIVPVTPDPLAMAGLERTLDVIAACDAGKPVQIALGISGEMTLALETFSTKLKERYGSRVVHVRFRAMPQPDTTPDPQLTASAA